MSLESERGLGGKYKLDIISMELPYEILVMDNHWGRQDRAPEAKNEQDNIQKSVEEEKLANKMEGKPSVK